MRRAITVSECHPQRDAIFTFLAIGVPKRCIGGIESQQSFGPGHILSWIDGAQIQCQECISCLALWLLGQQIEEIGSGDVGIDVRWRGYGRRRNDDLRQALLLRGHSRRDGRSCRRCLGR